MCVGGGRGGGGIRSCHISRLWSKFDGRIVPDRPRSDGGWFIATPFDNWDRLVRSHADVEVDGGCSEMAPALPGSEIRDRAIDYVSKPGSFIRIKERSRWPWLPILLDGPVPNPPIDSYGTT